jgi:hypothetical protein
MALKDFKESVEHWISIDTLLQVFTYGSLLSFGVIYFLFV